MVVEAAEAAACPSLQAPPTLPKPCFTWANIPGEDFAHALDAAYAEVVTWRRNLFNVPSGRNGKAFVAELARLFHAYAGASALEGIALKATMVMPHLLLQKPSQKSKAKDHCVSLGLLLRMSVPESS